MLSNKKVLLGMSGGVDSSVSAALLLEQGYEVIGAFMKNWSGDVNGPECKSSDRVGDEYQECGWKQERRDAARVAAKLGIPFLTFDFEDAYRQEVVEQMFAEFQAGRTPNPDVWCNKYIKFDRFVKAADELGCAFVATGHYARTICHPEPYVYYEGEGSPTLLQKAVDHNKDQTYFLWAIKKEVLPRILFPIGHLTKPEVREKARELGLNVAEKKDSTGICFVGDVAMQDFLKARINEDPGNVVTSEGVTIGTHIGLNFYTIGQRHGLNIGGGTPYYVVEKRPQTKELVVTSNFHPALFKKTLHATQLNFLVAKESLTSNRFHARIRHRQPLQLCTAEFTLDEASVIFDEPQRAVTPGQSIVFYQENIVVGGGSIN